MSEPEQSAHIMTSPIDEAEELGLDHSKFSPGIFRFEVDFDRAEFERLRAACARGPEAYTRFHQARRPRTRRT